MNELTSESPGSGGDAAVVHSPFSGSSDSTGSNPRRACHGNARCNEP